MNLIVKLTQNREISEYVSILEEFIKQYKDSYNHEDYAVNNNDSSLFSPNLKLRINLYLAALRKFNKESYTRSNIYDILSKVGHSLVGLNKFRTSFLPSSNDYSATLEEDFTIDKAIALYQQKLNMPNYYKEIYTDRYTYPSSYISTEDTLLDVKKIYSIKELKTLESQMKIKQINISTLAEHIDENNGTNLDDRIERALLLEKINPIILTSTNIFFNLIEELIVTRPLEDSAYTQLI